MRFLAGWWLAVRVHDPAEGPPLLASLGVTADALAAGLTGPARYMHANGAFRAGRWTRGAEVVDLVEGIGKKPMSRPPSVTDPPSRLRVLPEGGLEDASDGLRYRFHLG